MSYNQQARFFERDQRPVDVRTLTIDEVLGLAPAVEGIPLPEFPLPPVPGVPAGTVWRLDNAAVGRSGNYITLWGTIQ